MQQPDVTTRPHLRPLALALVILVAAALRIYWNDLAVYDGIDEGHYLNVARALAPSFFGKYPAVADEYVTHSTAWKYPSLLRWGSHGLAAAVCRLQPTCSYRTLAWISTVAGIAAVALAYAVGRARLGARAALVGASFVTVSPLQLALGRRALQDELVCASVLLALWAALRVLDAPRDAPAAGRYALAIAAATFAFAVKETFVLYAPAFVALWWLARPRRGGGRPLDAALLLGPPLLYYAGYCAVTRTTTQFLDMARIAVTALGFEYARQYQSGPPQRYLIDLIALSPVTVLLAVAAVAALFSPRGGDGAPQDERSGAPAEATASARDLAAFAVLAMAAFSLASKNARFIAAQDALIALLAGWFVVHVAERAQRPARVIAAAAILVTVTNLTLFQQVFLDGRVIDPTTYEILQALEAVPR